MNHEHGVRFWVAVALGGAVMGYGIWGALDESAATHPRSLATWIVGADLLHDLLIAPLVCAVGFVLTRWLREPWRTPVRAGLVISAIIVVVGWPSLRGYGSDRVPDNASVQPLDYSTAIATVLIAVWVGVGVWLAVRAVRRRGRGPSAVADG